MNEQELREQIAKEIEAKEMTIVKIEDPNALKTHPDCWKCGEPAQEQLCNESQQQRFRYVKNMFANIARGNK